MWSLQKPDRFWKVTVDYCKPHLVAPTAAAVPDVISLLEETNAVSDTWYGVAGRANTFFSIPVRKKCQKQFTFTWDRQSCPGTMPTLLLSV